MKVFGAFLHKRQYKNDSTELKNTASFEIAALFPTSYRRVKTVVISKLGDSLDPSSRSYIVLHLVPLFAFRQSVSVFPGQQIRI